VKTYRIDVYGRVQGVFFRRMTKDYCDKNGLRGNVENQTDGSVLIYVQCTLDELRVFIRWLESSPGASKVERAEMEIIYRKKFEDFQVIRSKGAFWKDKGGALKNLGKQILKL